VPQWAAVLPHQPADLHTINMASEICESMSAYRTTCALGVPLATCDAYREFPDLPCTPYCLDHTEVLDDLSRIARLRRNWKASVFGVIEWSALVPATHICDSMDTNQCQWQRCPARRHLHSILEAILAVQATGVEWFFHITLEGTVFESDIGRGLSEAQGQRKNNGVLHEATM
jgi:hypothetical protein